MGVTSVSVIAGAESARPSPLVSVVFVTYRRIDLLRETHSSFMATCKYPSIELIVCDDGSPPEVQVRIREMEFDKFLLAPRNQGIAANTNKGLLAATGEFVLQLQDDWHCRGPADFIEAGIELMEECKDVCMVQYWREPTFPYPSRMHVTASGRRARVFLDYPGMVASGSGFYIYSDCPHLRRTASRETVGLYSSRKRMSEVEADYCRRFECLEGQRVAIIEGYGGVFQHTGADQTFNWDQKKENIRKRLRAHPVLRHAWNLYCHIRYGRRG